ncbi:hypothetical protein NP493_220g03034 [Ridgeia piscesae]|uniref:Uncharacterized protein n=1 Tax=Ridgeia piscesae TaxID=27915 RepID=A0AAD9P0U3_RIDPI|nr:hypothetical protein NP493_220g03034 [Ridgeia piscesae]
MVTTAVINEDATSNLIRELKEQIAELEKDTKSGPDNEALQMQLHDELVFTMKKIVDLEEFGAQKWGECKEESQAEIKAREQEKEDQKTIPHFWNLNEDPSLTHIIIHFTRRGETTLGSSEANSPLDVTLAGDLNRQEKKKKVIPAPSYESALSEVVKNNFTGDMGKELFERFQMDQDPFWTDHETEVLGRVQLPLKSLALNQGMDDELEVTDYHGKVQG